MIKILKINDANVILWGDNIPENSEPILEDKQLLQNSYSDDPITISELGFIPSDTTDYDSCVVMNYDDLVSELSSKRLGIKSQTNDAKLRKYNINTLLDLKQSYTEIRYKISELPKSIRQIVINTYSYIINEL